MGDDRWLLVSDLDCTLTGDDAALRRFIAAANASPELLVAVNSSRPLLSQDATLAGLDIEFIPDAMIGAMGMEIRVGGRPLDAWAERFAGWDRSIVDRMMADLGFEPHAPELQRPYKASFAVPAGEAQRQAEAAIRATGLEARIIRSGASDFDVLPPGAGKDHATLYLAGHLGIEPDRLIVAGDSANDLAMFRVCRRGIVVANARDELREAVNEGRAYFADRPSAGGVLEGLAHWGVPLAERERL